MKYLFLIAVAGLFVGCAPLKTWVATSKTDQFTDVTTQTASANFAVGPYGWNKLSLFVSTRTNQVLVGVSSSLGVPVGTVQLRIDQNPPWEISPDETPLYMTPALPHTSTNGSIQAAQAEVMTGMSKIMSPFTATTGDKAEQILKQMVHGTLVRYRTIGVNQAASTTGEIKIDESFLEALKRIGIDTSKY
jgi:hypothetical protein